MGINICVQGLDGTEEPSWDSIRFAGDRELGGLFGELETERHNIGSEFEPDFVYRPKDISAWRSAVAAREWPNPGRPVELLDLLERRPDLWVYISY